jgi:hypothetical protein
MQITNLEECWPCPVFANYTLAFALQLREKQGKTSIRVAKVIQIVLYRAIFCTLLVIFYKTFDGCTGLNNTNPPWCHKYNWIVFPLHTMKASVE